jgi:Transmembrane secretion effector
LAITLPVSLRFHVLRGEQPDLSPHEYTQPAPQLAAERDEDEGPIRVSVDYLIDPEDYDAFIHTMYRMRDVRMRDGAIRWGVYQDLSNPRRVNETFVTESWLEYLRQRERFTASDLAIGEEVWSFHRGAAPPVTSYMLYIKETTLPTSSSEGSGIRKS